MCYRPSPSTASDIAAWQWVGVGDGDGRTGTDGADRVGGGWGSEAGLQSSGRCTEARRCPGRVPAPPHLVVKPKVLHVHAQEAGVHVERPHLASRRDVEDDVSEAASRGTQDGAAAPFQGHSLPAPPTLLPGSLCPPRPPLCRLPVPPPLTVHLPTPQEPSPASSALGCLESRQTAPAPTSAAGVPSPSPPASPWPCRGDAGTRTERRAGLRSPAARPCPAAGRPCSGGPAASSRSRSS